MSKIGKMPVILKEGISVTIANRTVTAVGPKGTLSFAMPGSIEAVLEDGKVIVKIVNPSEKALFGLTRAMIANMVKGVSEGFEKKLELTGVGYRAQAAGADLTLSVGFSHQVKIKAPAGVTFTVAENTITVAGSDKKLVGDMAAKVRSVRPPEPYKGKGIKYAGERIRRKAGKTAKAVGGK
jgi:large subunit ribosomal protein L6